MVSREVERVPGLEEECAVCVPPQHTHTCGNKSLADIGMALRKIALLLKPDKEIDHQGNHMIVKTLSTFRNYILEFDVGVEFEEDLRIVDGRKCQTIVTWEEEQLVCVQKGEVPNRGWRHWLEGEQLYLELTARDAVCEQVFRKVK